MPFSVNNFDLGAMPKVKDGPLIRQSPLNNEQEDELITVFKDIVNHERDSELAKIRLAQQSDFNLMDAFQMIDLESKGWITAPQLLDNLQSFGCFCHKDDIYTFVRKYDQDSDGRMLYSDFCDAFTPRDSYYVSQLSNKQARYIHTNTSKFNYFDAETRELIWHCFRTQFEAEESIELLKKRLTRRPKFNVRDTFAYMDCFEQGMLTTDAFKRVLQENKFYPTENELLSLFTRFDKNHNGRVNY